MCLHNEVLFSCKEAQNYVICLKIDGPGDDDIRLNKFNSERCLSNVFFSFVGPRLYTYSYMPCKLRGHWGRKEMRRSGEKGILGFNMVKVHYTLRNFSWEPSSCIMNECQ